MKIYPIVFPLYATNAFYFIFSIAFIKGDGFLCDGAGHACRSVAERDACGVSSGIRRSGVKNGITLLIDDSRSVDTSMTISAG